MGTSSFTPGIWSCSRSGLSDNLYVSESGGLRRLSPSRGSRLFETNTKSRSRGEWVDGVETVGGRRRTRQEVGPRETGPHTWEVQGVVQVFIERTREEKTGGTRHRGGRGSLPSQGGWDSRAAFQHGANNKTVTSPIDTHST